MVRPLLDHALIGFRRGEDLALRRQRRRPRAPMITGAVEALVVLADDRAEAGKHRRAAENALFFKSPASAPGYFLIDLKTDSDVQLTVKSTKTGLVVHQHRTAVTKDVPSGETWAGVPARRLDGSR